MILSGRVGIWGQEWVQPKHAGRLLSWCPCTDWTHPIQGSRGERQASKAEASMVRTWGMDLKRNKAVVGEFDDLGNGGGNLARLDELCGADIVNHALAPGRPQGLEGTRQFLRSAHRDVLHSARWLESRVVAEGDLVVQFGRREHSWPGGSFSGLRRLCRNLQERRCLHVPTRGRQDR